MADSRMEEPTIISRTPQPLTITYANRNITMLSLSSVELDAVASLGSSLNLTFFGLCFGALVSLAIVLTTAEGLSSSVHAGYVALTAVALIGSAYFGIRGVLDISRSRRELKRIKDGR